MKALLRFTGSEDSVFSRPFTVVDPQGTVWSVATDRIWFVAAKGHNSCPRFKGEASSLGTILRLLRIEPVSPIPFESDDVMRRMDPDGLGSVMGVVVNLKRLYDLLRFPGRHLLAWNATEALGVPALGITGDEWRAFLMGFENLTGDIPVFSLTPTEKSLFDEIMGLGEEA